MSRVAVATCADFLVDPDSPVLLDALEREGVDAQLCVWDDPSVHWDRFDLVVVRSTWDYAPRLAQFLEWARSVPRLANPYAAIEYSSDKHYLGDLYERGHRVVETSFVEVGEEAVFPEGDFVVKPCVGAGSIDADRYQADELAAARDHVTRLHAQGRGVMVQPYVSSVDTRGERALVFIDGSFSHAMTKGAMLNTAEVDRSFLFRREQMSLAVAEPAAVAMAEAILAESRFSGLLYARVDLVVDHDAWSLMELELVEPSLFLQYDGRAATRLASAIARRCA